MGWKIRDLTGLTGSTQATFSPAAYLFAQFTRHAIYQGFSATGGSDGHLYEFYASQDDVWHNKDLTAEAEAPLATAYPTAYIFATTGTQHVLYVGAPFDGHVHELWWDDDGWQHHDLTEATRAALALTVPTGYELYADGTQHVVYQDQQRHIQELWWKNGAWHFGDLTATVGAPPAASAPGGYAFEAQGTQHVVYRSDDGHIQELWWDATGWHHGDLSAAAGAPTADDDPTGYVFRTQGTQHVNFRGVDGHIHELWWDATGWHHFNLTAATGAPLAPPGFRPSGYGFDTVRQVPVATQHVLYSGTDSHVHELWWDPTGWHHHDLTGAPDAPPSISNPAGFVEVDDASQHVFYNSDNHHIVELYWRP